MSDRRTTPPGPTVENANGVGNPTSVHHTRLSTLTAGAAIPAALSAGGAIAHRTIARKMNDRRGARMASGGNPGPVPPVGEHEMETGLAREVRLLDGVEPVTRASPVHGHDITRLDFEEGLAVEPPSDHSRHGIAEDHVVPPEHQRPPLDRQLVPNHGPHRAPADPALIHRLQRVGDLDMAGADRHREDMEVVVRPGALRDLAKHGLEQLLWRPLLKSIFQVAV